MGRKLGLTEAKLRALASFEGAPELDETEKLALRYAVAEAAGGWARGVLE